MRSLFQDIALLPQCCFQFAQREAKHRGVGRRDGDFGGGQVCGAQKQRPGEKFDACEDMFHGGLDGSMINLLEPYYHGHTNR